MPMTIPEQVIQSLIVWIDENIHRQLHIDDIAKHAGYSKWHLQRILFIIAAKRWLVMSALGDLKSLRRNCCAQMSVSWIFV